MTTVLAIIRSIGRKDEKMVDNKYNERAIQAIVNADADEVESILEEAKAEGITKRWIWQRRGRTGGGI